MEACANASSAVAARRARRPSSAVGAPVVPGNVIGSPLSERTARYAHASASIASPSRPPSSAGTTAFSRVPRSSLHQQSVAPAAAARSPTSAAASGIMRARPRDRDRRQCASVAAPSCERQPINQAPGEVVAVERLRRRRCKYGCFRYARKPFPRLTMPARRERPVAVERRRRCAASPNRRSARCRARCRMRAGRPSAPIHVTFATPPMLTRAIGRSGSARRTRDDRPARAARLVLRPRHRRPADRRRHRRPVELWQQRSRRRAAPSAALRPVQHRLTVKADDVHASRAMPCSPRKASTASACSSVSCRSTSASDCRARGLALSADRAAPSIGSERRTSASRGIVSTGRGFTSRLAVGLDRGDIDAVHRRAAHQSNRAHPLAHSPVPVHGAPRFDRHVPEACLKIAIIRPPVEHAMSKPRATF